MITDNFHIKIVLILFITSIVLIVLAFKEDFVVNRFQKVIPITRKSFSDIFNIDIEIDKQPQNLGWKNFWRDNFNKSDITLENSYTNSPYDAFSDNNKFLYDGIIDISNS
tara:strand:- start:444 stop:773 length:330 start_codon:yes stop_codon:yes gene_type:complete